MCNEICNFYRNVIAPTEITINSEGTTTKKISPISRLNFCAGAGIAAFSSVDHVIRSIISLAKNIFTLGLCSELRTELLNNVKKALIYGGAIPVGLLGVFFPGTVNQRVLELF